VFLDLFLFCLQKKTPEKTNKTRKNKSHKKHLHFAKYFAVQNRRKTLSTKVESTFSMAKPPTYSLIYFFSHQEKK